ncbi:MAG TPA: hypothetical protein V6D29_13735 [Leptolyngbyaceae cyanobacterium]
MGIDTLPAMGSRWQWYNQPHKVYVVIDVFVAECGSLEVRYRSEGMPSGQYYQRSVASFYSETRSGQKRFVPA